MSSPVKILAGMQKIDLLIKGMEDEAKDYKVKIAGHEAEQEGIKGQIAAVDKELESLSSALGEVNIRITQANERIKKNEERIRSVSGNKELKALNKEMSTAGKIIRQAGKEADELKARQTEQELLREARVLEAERVSSEIDSLQGELEAKGAKWQDDLLQRKAERDTLRAEIDDAMYRVYENIRQKRGGTAVVPLKQEACQGCFMHVPTQLYVRLKRGDEEILRCPHCDRILYVEQTPAATTEAL
ncbi:MAG: zinc ribbon domain-containing protein [Thermodesulfobacteriota bacterium]